MTLQYTEIQQENPLPSPHEKNKTRYNAMYNGQCSDICWGLGAAGRDSGKTAGENKRCP